MPPHGTGDSVPGMPTRTIPIVLNGVTGRMGTNQHLVRSILAIIEQGGIEAGDQVLMPEPVLTGRNAAKLEALAEEHGRRVMGKALPWTTDVVAAMGDCEVFFDASSTLQRAKFIEMAVAADKALYCEKPTANDLGTAVRLAAICDEAGIKNGVVQDKLFLPGIRKLKKLVDDGFFGRILSVRGNFGYWVFTGHDPAQPAQRPSWNYRSDDGGGIVIDMFCHWRYVLDHTFGPVDQVFAVAARDITDRVGEDGKPYPATADDSAYAMFRMGNGLWAQFNSSWCTRVRRDDLLAIQVDGTEGSAVAGLRDCWVQSLADTPRPVWNPDVPQPIDFDRSWRKLEDGSYDNAFKVQWEMFLRHVALDEPWEFSLWEGAKGVQLAELGLESAHQGKLLDVPALM